MIKWQHNVYQTMKTLNNSCYFISNVSLQIHDNLKPQHASLNTLISELQSPDFSKMFSHFIKIIFNNQRFVQTNGCDLCL